MRIKRKLLTRQMCPLPWTLITRLFLFDREFWSLKNTERLTLQRSLERPLKGTPDMLADLMGTASLVQW